MKQTVSIIIPTLNEEDAIKEVITDAYAVQPMIKDYALELIVVDGRSTDNTVEEARSAGAIVRTEPIQGKGNVVRRMFSDIEADIYVMVGLGVLPAPRLASNVPLAQRGKSGRIGKQWKPHQ